MGIYAKENGQGLFFGKEDMLDDAQNEGEENVAPEDGTPVAPKRGKPSLRVVK
jgi:stringent starvation protein B